MKVSPKLWDILYLFLYIYTHIEPRARGKRRRRKVKARVHAAFAAVGEICSRRLNSHTEV